VIRVIREPTLASYATSPVHQFLEVTLDLSAYRPDELMADVLRRDAASQPVLVVEGRHQQQPAAGETADIGRKFASAVWR
jgi:hypothetical protein